MSNDEANVSADKSEKSEAKTVENETSPSTLENTETHMDTAETMPSAETDARISSQDSNENEAELPAHGVSVDDTNKRANEEPLVQLNVQVSEDEPTLKPVAPEDVNAEKPILTVEPERLSKEVEESSNVTHSEHHTMEDKQEVVCDTAENIWPENNENIEPDFVICEISRDDADESANEEKAENVMTLKSVVPEGGEAEKQREAEDKKSPNVAHSEHSERGIADKQEDESNCVESLLADINENIQAESVIHETPRDDTNENAIGEKTDESFVPINVQMSENSPTLKPASPEDVQEENPFLAVEPRHLPKEVGYEKNPNLIHSELHGIEDKQEVESDTAENLLPDNKANVEVDSVIYADAIEDKVEEPVVQMKNVQVNENSPALKHVASEYVEAGKSISAVEPELVSKEVEDRKYPSLHHSELQGIRDKQKVESHTVESPEKPNNDENIETGSRDDDANENAIRENVEETLIQMMNVQMSENSAILKAVDSADIEVENLILEVEPEHVSKEVEDEGSPALEHFKLHGIVDKKEVASDTVGSLSPKNNEHVGAESVIQELSKDDANESANEEKVEEPLVQINVQVNENAATLKPATHDDGKISPALEHYESHVIDDDQNMIHEQEAEPSAESVTAAILSQVDQEKPREETAIKNPVALVNDEKKYPVLTSDQELVTKVVENDASPALEHSEIPVIVDKQCDVHEQEVIPSAEFVTAENLSQDNAENLDEESVQESFIGDADKKANERNIEEPLTLPNNQVGEKTAIENPVAAISTSVMDESSPTEQETLSSIGSGTADKLLQDMKENTETKSVEEESVYDTKKSVIQENIGESLVKANPEASEITGTPKLESSEENSDNLTAEAEQVSEKVGHEIDSTMDKQSEATEGVLSQQNVEKTSEQGIVKDGENESTFELKKLMDPSSEMMKNIVASMSEVLENDGEEIFSSKTEPIEGIKETVPIQTLFENNTTPYVETSMLKEEKVLPLIESSFENLQNEQHIGTDSLKSLEELVEVGEKLEECPRNLQYELNENTIVSEPEDSKADEEEGTVLSAEPLQVSPATGQSETRNISDGSLALEKTSEAEVEKSLQSEVILFKEPILIVEDVPQLGTELSSANQQKDDKTAMAVLQERMDGTQTASSTEFAVLADDINIIEGIHDVLYEAMLKDEMDQDIGEKKRFSDVGTEQCVAEQVSDKNFAIQEAEMVTNLKSDGMINNNNDDKEYALKDEPEKVSIEVEKEISPPALGSVESLTFIAEVLSTENEIEVNDTNVSRQVPMEDESNSPLALGQSESYSELVSNENSSIAMESEQNAFETIPPNSQADNNAVFETVGAQEEPEAPLQVRAKEEPLDSNSESVPMTESGELQSVADNPESEPLEVKHDIAQADIENKTEALPTDNMVRTQEKLAENITACEVVASNTGKQDATALSPVTPDAFVEKCVKEEGAVPKGDVLVELLEPKVTSSEELAATASAEADEAEQMELLAAAADLAKREDIEDDATQPEAEDVEIAEEDEVSGKLVDTDDPMLATQEQEE
ncbi:uncharacterized protein LOC129771325 [Toxorhynchites rutilus septentrionalis]|uniref:uncharacterized protein LOC129771325 n=1 Tax=Toxorhynchites rutilus septentrionalis TaxID=329112 RepID=UPI00247B0977|nr:uncharacterized protein LOC129771325 [Toxorhynchites rutilus septentrionalis]XP_055630832.1 uncharacterized protein LOC129771325 [Toxorhynchites rutilus septentrionalis]